MGNENAWTIRKDRREEREREKRRDEKKREGGEHRTLVWRTKRRAGRGRKQDDSVLGHASLSGKLLIP